MLKTRRDVLVFSEEIATKIRLALSDVFELRKTNESLKAEVSDLEREISNLDIRLHKLETIKKELELKVIELERGTYNKEVA